MKSAITVCITPEARGGPFVFHDGLADGFARAAALGFDAVEIFPPSAEALNLPEIRALCSKHNLKVAAVGTGAGWLTKQLRLTDPNEAVRTQARSFIDAIVDAAGELGAPAILGSMQGRWGDGVSREQALSWLAEALEGFGPRAEKHGVPFLYEFLNRYETNLFNRVADSAQFCGSLKTKNVKLLCDLFHMNIEEANLAEAIRGACGQIGHVHFADSNRSAIGMGHTDAAAAVKALREGGYDGYLSAEIFPVPDADTAARRTIESFRRLNST